MALYRAQVVLNRDLWGDDVTTNTMVLRTEGGAVTEADAQTVANAVEQLYTGGGGLLIRLSSKYRCERIKVYDVVAEGQPLVDEPVNALGSTPGGNLPAQVAMSVTFKTAVRKRWGRIYLPGQTMDGMDPATGLFTTAWCGAIANSFSAWTTNVLGPAQMALVVTSRNQDEPGNIVSPVQSFQVDNIPDVIRRRRAEAGKTRSVAAHFGYDL